MSLGSITTLNLAPARRKLLDAALAMIREKGYAATTIDDLCARAGVAKGSFFHHFRDKEAFAVAAADYWSETTGTFFAAAPYHRHKDPLDRVFGYLELRRSVLAGEVSEFTCLVGTMVQEIHGTNPAIRDACDASISGHAGLIEADIAEAMKLRGIRAKWTAKSLALHMQAVLQGAFILAKAKGGAEIAISSVDHLRRYIELLFSPTNRRGKMTARITIEANTTAPIEKAWRAYTTPEDIKQWNAASDDWHTPSATVDLRVGGAFCWRMEARDGSAGFDFAGTYTRIEEGKLIEYSFGDRTARVEFLRRSSGARVRVTFDGESTHSIEQQRHGWQAILDRFSRHVAARA